MSDDHISRRQSHALGWPALVVIAAVIAVVLYLTYVDDDAATRVKPATGSAQAMSLATERGEPARR